MREERVGPLSEGEPPDMSGLFLQSPAVQLEQLEVREGTRLTGHGHDVPHLLYVAGGECQERHLGRWRRVPRGTWRISPEGDEHDLLFTARSRCLLVLLQGNPGGVAPPRIAERRFHRDPYLGSLGEGLRRIVSRRAEASSLALEGQVLEVLAATAPVLQACEGRRRPKWLERVRERVRDRPTSPPSTRTLALDAGVHPVYLARAFRRYFGIGLGEYARVVRAENARRLLVETDAPLSDVALAAGFSDQAHLSRWMRRLLGRTPLELRRRGEVIEVSRVQYGGVRRP